MKAENRKKKVLSGVILLVFTLMTSCVFAVNPSEVVRVGITDNQFQKVLKQEIVIFGTAECELCDKATRKVIAKIPAGQEMIIRNTEQGLCVIVNGQMAILQDIVIISPKGLLGVKVY